MKFLQRIIVFPVDDPTLKDIIRKIAQGKFILNSTCRNRIYRQSKFISITSFDTINQHNPLSQPGPGPADEVMIGRIGYK